MTTWHQRRISRMEASLDWSRVFVSVLFVDSENSNSYVRARLAQRYLDAIAEWNGVGKVIEAYACSVSNSVEAAEPDDSTVAGQRTTQKLLEFAGKVGLDEEQRDQIMRKLGVMWSTSLEEEDLREHDVIVALDRAAYDAVGEQLRLQGLGTAGQLSEGGGGGQRLLFSDFVWLYGERQAEIHDADCTDGSGTAMFDDAIARSLRRLEFEADSERQLVAPPSQRGESLRAPGGLNLDLPPWPDVRGGASPGTWRKLYSPLLRGSVALAWSLLGSWQREYCNPLSK